jgi:hypothetical protein
MSDLSAFYMQNSVVETTEDFVVSPRFKGKDGKAIPWKLRSITEAENQEIRKAATKRTKAKYGQYTSETDPNEYVAKLVTATVVYPNLKDAALQETYGVKGAEALVRKMLLPGEFTKLTDQVQSLNGFDQDINELVEEVKN